MKKILVIACAILFVFSATAVALESVNYVEDGTGLVPDNEWTDNEVYTFLGGLTLEPGTYDLVFELHGTVWCEVNGTPCTWGDGDEIRVKALVDGNEVASVVKSDISGSEVSFTVQLEIDFHAGTTVNLAINSWETVTDQPTEKWQVESATLTGTFEPAGLVGFWKFDEANGSTALDSSDFGNDGTIIGATRTSGKCGNALSFDGGMDGTYDYVVIPNSDSINTNTFTVSCWVKLPDLDGHYHFLDKRNDQWYRNFSLSYHGNDVRPEGDPNADYLRVQIGDGTYMPNDYDNSAHAQVSLNQNQYYNVAGTYDGNTLRLYLDGNEIASEDIVMDSTGNGEVHIGTHGYPYMTPMVGIIDEVRIYNYALTQEQIQADMEACVPETYAVHIDIKPESCPNPLNTKSQGVLPVAILGTVDFDVTSIDGASIRLSDVAPIRSTVEDVATPVLDPQNGCECNELGGDGTNDLTLKFNTQEIVDAIGDVEDREEVELTITGVLSDETPFEGKDCIVIRAKGGKGKVEEPDQCYNGVPKTGQTTCYAPNGDEMDCAGTGQDGDLQKGVPWPIPRFTNNGNGTVTDHLTRLVWLQNANIDGRKTWAAAIDFCNNLASGSYGLTDGSNAGEWRLPNIFELFSLLDFGEKNPALPPGHPFSIFDEQTWSSSTHDRETLRAWHVHFDDGRVQYSYKEPNENNVWCVRDGN